MNLFKKIIAKNYLNYLIETHDKLNINCYLIVRQCIDQLNVKNHS